jgi:ketosteroid isomerase-like protein
MRFAVAIAAIALATVLPRPCLAQSEEQRVLAAEDEYVAAEVNRDEATLRRLVDDRFVLNSNNGSTSGKEELIRSILRMTLVGQTIRERTVLIEGEVAMIFGTADLRFLSAGGSETVSSLRYTSTYVNRDGQWRMLALQMQQQVPR